MTTRSALALLALVPLALAGTPEFAPLPQKASSLGVCASDGWLYAYGGHTGKTHTYSAETTIGKFRRAPLAGGKWEELPSGPAAQGLALVAHKGKIYRVGGMQPRNRPGEKADNHSLSSFAVYDPSAKKWQDLPDLPEGRSSHDAAIVGDRLYVFGGWKMNGEGKASTWHKGGLMIDLSSSTPKWVSVDQPFARRALAVAAVAGKVYVLGGLQAKGGPTTQVDVFDPATGKWSIGPALPGEGTGFSPSACALDGRLYAGTNDGKVHRLDEAGKAWEAVGTQAVARHVSRLVPGEKGALLVVGGTGRKGDARAVEVIVPTAK